MAPREQRRATRPPALTGSETAGLCDATPSAARPSRLRRRRAWPARAAPFSARAAWSSSLAASRALFIMSHLPDGGPVAAVCGDGRELVTVGSVEQPDDR